MSSFLLVTWERVVVRDRLAARLRLRAAHTAERLGLRRITEHERDALLAAVRAAPLDALDRALIHRVPGLRAHEPVLLSGLPASGHAQRLVAADAEGDDG